MQPAREEAHEKDSVQIRQLDPDPEEMAIERDLQEKLQKGLQMLPPAQRILIRLRYEQGLNLAACAEFAGLENAQMADRQIRSILGRLRSLIEI